MRLARLLLVVSCCTAFAARADEPGVQSPGSATTTPPTPLAAQKARCGCAAARLLDPQKGLVFDGTRAVSAWLHGSARLSTFRAEPAGAGPPTLLEDALPLAVEPFDLRPFGPSVTSSNGFIRVYPREPVEGAFYVGVLRPRERAPRDVLAVTSSLAAPTATAPPTGPAPVVDALWLAPLEQRERPGCGVFVTHRYAASLHAGSPAIEALLVRFLDEQGRATTAALIDERAASVYGIGRIDACGEGLELPIGKPLRIEVRPISAAFGVGDPWVFTSTGGIDDLSRASVPASGDAALAAEPFPSLDLPAKDTHASKRIALWTWGLLVVGAAAIAGVVWVVIPRRRRRIRELACPSCGKLVPLDVLDPDTDGFFCPGCGKTSVWKGAATTDDVKLEKVDVG